MRAVLNWLLRDLRAELQTMRTEMNDRLDKIQAAEDRLGQSVARATSQNAANVKALADAIAKAQAQDATPADDEALDKILAQTVAAADKLDAAFPSTPDETAASGAADDSGNIPAQSTADPEVGNTLTGTVTGG